MQYPLKLNSARISHFGSEYVIQIELKFDGIKLMKIPTGYYDRLGTLGKCLQNEFSRNVPMKGHAEISPCQIDSYHDKITRKVSLSTKNIVDFRMFILNAFNAHIWAGCTQLANKSFIIDTICFIFRAGIFS